MEKANGEFEVSIIIPVNEFYNLIQPYRRKYTKSGLNELSPHATILYPFIKNKERYDRERHKIEEICKNIQKFNLKLDSLGRFEEAGVLYIKPLLNIDYTTLVKAFIKYFPDIKPYNGIFPVAELHPHITIAVEKDRKKLDMIEKTFEIEFDKIKSLSIDVNEFWIAVKSDNTWYEYDRFTLCG